MKELTVDEIKKIYSENSFIKCRKYWDIDFWCMIPLVVVNEKGEKTTVYRWGINSNEELQMESGKFKGNFISLKQYKNNESYYKKIYC
jgi:hypothetical protein